MKQQRDEKQKQTRGVKNPSFFFSDVNKERMRTQQHHAQKKQNMHSALVIVDPNAIDRMKTKNDSRDQSKKFSFGKQK